MPLLVLPPKSILTKIYTKLMLCKPPFKLSFMTELRSFKTYTGVQQTKHLSSKSVHGTCTTRLYKYKASSLIADK